MKFGQNYDDRIEGETNEEWSFGGSVCTSADYENKKKCIRTRGEERAKRNGTEYHANHYLCTYFFVLSPVSDCPESSENLHTK